MSLTIRRLCQDEGDKLVSIWCRSIDATHHFLSADYRAELEELVRSFLPEAPLWVAVIEQDESVAFMLLTDQHTDALFVDPSMRDSGVGKLLVEHALPMSSTLTTNVNEQNEQAVGSYKKMGLSMTGHTEVDDLGRPYPLLNLVRGQQDQFLSTRRVRQYADMLPDALRLSDLQNTFSPAPAGRIRRYAAPGGFHPAQTQKSPSGGMGSFTKSDAWQFMVGVRAVVAQRSNPLPVDLSSLGERSPTGNR